ncbi:MAG: DUF1549 domain-containing protein, partial [Acidobacteriota bacterium]
MERARIGRILLLFSYGILGLTWLGGVLAREAVQAGQGERQVSFARDIRPILAERCLGCHNGSRMSGGLRLDRPDGVRRDSIIVPGRAAESRLYQRINATGDEAMPPTGEKLTTAQIGLIRDWIDAGAIWPEETAGAPAGQTHWAWRPVTRPAIPRPAIPRPVISGARSGPGHPIDAFIQERLTREGLRMSAEADRRTLIRRLSYDLTGLPPTPERVARFVGDRDPQAYEKLVDELLASP